MHIDLHPDDRKLRQFAGLCLFFFSIAGLWQAVAHGHRTAALVLVALGTSLSVVGYLRARALRPVFVGWTLLVWPIGWLVSQALLAAVYYAVLTPMACVLRWTGRDALDLRRPQGGTHWMPKAISTDKRSYLRQY